MLELGFRAGRAGRSKREGHRSLHDNPAVDAREAFELSHALAQAFDSCLDLDHVAGIYSPPVSHPIDAHEEGQLLPVLGLREDQDRTHLRDALGENRGRERRRLARLVRQIALVELDVLDADNPLVGFELRDAVHEQERKAVRQNPLDGGVVEREDQLFNHDSGVGQPSIVPPLGGCVRHVPTGAECGSPSNGTDGARNAAQPRVYPPQKGYTATIR